MVTLGEVPGSEGQEIQAAIHQLHFAQGAPSCEAVEVFRGLFEVVHSRYVLIWEVLRYLTMLTPGRVDNMIFLHSMCTCDFFQHKNGRTRTMQTQNCWTWSAIS